MAMSILAAGLLVLIGLHEVAKPLREIARSLTDRQALQEAKTDDR
jgi:hypothetical protein